jgi:hypothetical protein
MPSQRHLRHTTPPSFAEKQAKEWAEKRRNENRRTPNFSYALVPPHAAHDETD